MDLKSDKGKQEWARACKDAYFCLQKLKTIVKSQFISKVIIFKETLEFKNVINNVLFVTNYCLAKKNSHSTNTLGFGAQS